MALEDNHLLLTDGADNLPTGDPPLSETPALHRLRYRQLTTNNMRVPTVTLLTMAALAAQDLNSQASTIPEDTESQTSEASTFIHDSSLGSIPSELPVPTSISPPETLLSQAVTPSQDLEELKQLISETLAEKLESERARQNEFIRDRLLSIDQTRRLLNVFILIFSIFTIGGCSLFWLLYRRVVDNMVEELKLQIEQIIETDNQLKTATQTANGLVADLEKKRDYITVNNKSVNQNVYADIINLVKEQVTHPIKELSAEFKREVFQLIQQQIYPIKNDDVSTIIPGYRLFMPSKTTPIQQIKKAEELMEQAKVLAFEGNYAQAIALYEKTIAIEPNLSEAWYQRGNVLARLQHYESAIADYDQAIAIEPRQYQVWYSRGWVLENLQRDAEAIESYDRAISLEPQRYELWYDRGKALERLQRYSEALTSYSKATAIQPDDYQLWYDRGVLLSKSQRYEEAIACYDRVVALKPDYPLIWRSRGVVLEKMQQYQEAIASYDRAIASNPHDYESWRSRGTALAGLQQYQEAIACFSKAMEIQNQLETAAGDR